MYVNVMLYYDVFLRRFCGRRQEVSNQVKFLYLLLFFYDIIFVVFL